jgi:hypothetical protein
MEMGVKEMCEFSVTKVGKVYLVEGEYSVGSRGAKERYSRAFRTKKEADSDAARWTRIEKEAAQYRSEIRARRIQAVLAYLAKRAERKALDERQLDLFACRRLPLPK